MKQLLIGLVHSPNKKFTKNQNYGLLFPPVWAYVLSTYITQFNGRSVLFDLNIINAELITECDIYFFSGINQDLESILCISEILKHKYTDKLHFIGGPIAWSFDKAGELQKLNKIDHICIGDGELLVPEIIESLTKNKKLPKVVKISQRFDLQKTLAMDSELINKTSKNYYGSVIEVSRGCPFLCEFCDIRVMTDNNRAHCRSIKTIINELNTYRLLGVKNIQIACDNFIGDLAWAKILVREIIIFNKYYNWTPSFYTWLTINIANNEELMLDMRNAGFDNLFIGVESFDNNTLLETAKLQNTKACMIESLRKIQSFGFIVVAGLIFGFDSDTDASFDNTLDGILKSGLLSGDASLLTALPGTPLYRRMKLSNRLRNFKNDSFLGGYKYVTNIKYLLSTKVIASGYIKFSINFMSGKFQLLRLKNYYSIICNSPNYINVQRAGYTDIFALIKLFIFNPTILLFFVKKLFPVIFSIRFFYLVKAIVFVIHKRITHGIGFQFFIFWLFIWTSSINKYENIKYEDFDIESVPLDFNWNDLIPKGYREQATEEIPEKKINAQFKATVTQLSKVIELKLLNTNNVIKD